MFAKSPKLFLITFICCLPLVAVACGAATTNVPTATPPPTSPIPTTAVPPTVAPPTDVSPTPTFIAPSTKSPTQEDKHTSTPRPSYTLSITSMYDGDGGVRVRILSLNNLDIAGTLFEYMQSEEYSLPGDRYKLFLTLYDVDGSTADTKTHLFTLGADKEILINNINDVEIK